MEKPSQKPHYPCFSSGPCAKPPGWSFDKLKGAELSRSHRSKPAVAKLQEVIDKSRSLLQIPDDYWIGIVPASDTGALEMAMWCLLGQRGVEVYSWEKFSEGITEIFAKSFTHKEISILIDFYSNLGLRPRDISNFKALIKKAERIEEASIQYIYENSQSCVREDSKLINNFLNRKLISQQTKLRSHE